MEGPGLTRVVGLRGVRGQVDWGCQAGVKGSGLVKGSAAQLSPSLQAKWLDWSIPGHSGV